MSNSNIMKRMKNIIAKRILHFCLMAAVLAGFVSGCENAKEMGSEIDTQTTTTVTISVPEAQIETRALTSADESIIKEIDVLVFNEIDKTFSYRIHGSGIVKVGNEFKFNVMLKKSEVNQSFVVFANLRASVDTAVKGFTTSTTKADALTKIKLTVDTKWNTSGLPMWGESDKVHTIGSSFTNIGTIRMLRSMAKIDVTLNKGGVVPNFELNVVELHRAMNEVQGGPNESNYTKDAGSLVANFPSVPSSAAPLTMALSYSVPVGSSEIIDQIYTPESLNSSKDKDTRTCLLIGGRFGGSSSAVTWYRVDISNGTIFYDILRNFHYKVNITKVNGPGFPNQAEALASEPMNNIVVTITSSNLGDSEVVFDGQYYLSVSSDTLSMYNDGVSDILTITTNCPSGWSINTTASPAGIPNTDNGFSARKGIAGISAQVTLKYPTIIPTGGGQVMFDIKAGNLIKKAVVTIANKDRPGIINEFLLPPVLYFANVGGNTNLSVTTNVAKADFVGIGGEIAMTLGAQSPANSQGVNVKVEKTGKTGANNRLSGKVNVSIVSSNAEIATSTNIVQFTKELNSTLDPASSNGDTKQVVWDAETFRIQNKPTTATESGNGYDYVYHIGMLLDIPVPSNLVGAPYVALPAPTSGYNVSFNPSPKNYSNRSYTKRTIARITPHPASKAFTGSNNIGIPVRDAAITVEGHSPDKYTFDIVQAGKSNPTFTFATFNSSSIAWNTPNVTINITPTNIVDGEIPKYELTFNNPNSMLSATVHTNDERNATTNNASPVFEIPLTKNRTGSARTATVTAAKATGFVKTIFDVGGAKPTITQPKAADPNYANITVVSTNPENAKVSKGNIGGLPGIIINTGYKAISTSPSTIISIADLEKANLMNIKTNAPFVATGNGITLGNLIGETAATGDNQEPVMSFTLTQDVNENIASREHTTYYKMNPHNLGTPDNQATRYLTVLVRQAGRPNGEITVADPLGGTVGYKKALIPAAGGTYTFNPHYTGAETGWVMVDYSDIGSDLLNFNRRFGKNGQSIDITIPKNADGKIARDIVVNFQSEDGFAKTSLRLRQEHGTVLNVHTNSIIDDFDNAGSKQVVDMAPGKNKVFAALKDAPMNINFAAAMNFCKDNNMHMDNEIARKYKWRVPFDITGVMIANRVRTGGGVSRLGIVTNRGYWVNSRYLDGKEQLHIKGTTWTEIYCQVNIPVTTTANMTVRCVIYVPATPELTSADGQPALP